jgi:enoyl-CoA hydratase
MGTGEGTYQDLLVEHDREIAVVRLDRPHKHNALGRHFWAEFRRLLGDLEADRRTRAVILTGTGDRAFSAGGDIDGFAELDGLAARRQYMIGCMRTFAAIEESPLPVIAAVNGLALGGGCELALACDFVVASSTATFAMPEAAVGLTPGFGVLRGPSAIGRHWTKYMILTGLPVSADEALHAGLVQKVVAADQLMVTALGLAATIAGRAPLAVSVGKRIVNRGVDRGEFDYAVEALSLLFSTEDAAEGIQAFQERRPPKFKGR